MTRVPWHRVFHPLSGADPLTLLRLLGHGAPSPRGAPAYAVALACSGLRLPFTLAEAAAHPLLPMPAPPVFIVGHPRSGTTHLHNLMAASGAFATVPPVLAGMPWEGRGLGRIMRPFIDMYLPETRLIDQVRLAPDAPTEDEVALANMCGLSYFHAFYFPRGFAETYARGLLFAGATGSEIAARERALGRYVRTMARRRRGPLLLKNPAYTAQLGWLRRLFPDARVIHIHRDPWDVFASSRRSVRTVLRELALQAWDEAEVDEAILAAYPPMMRALLRDARAMPEGRFASVSFEALLADPSGELAALWSALDLPEPSRSLARIERYLASLEGYRQNDNALSPSQRRAVGRRWRPIHERLGARAGHPRAADAPAPPRGVRRVIADAGAAREDGAAGCAPGR